MLSRGTWFAAILAGAAVLLASCGSTKPESAKDRSELDRESDRAMRALVKADEGLQKWFDTAYGYAVFPSVTKAAVGLGGAYGRGQVYEQGDLVGYATLSQGTIGFQLGGQAYSEVIFFKHRTALTEFRRGSFALAAQVSAVAAKAGASADAGYDGGVAVFTLAKGGLMFEASVGGQKFKYQAK